MHPSRFADWLFLYAGVSSFVQYGFVNGLQLTVDSIWLPAMGIIFCLTALSGFRQPAEDGRPSEYGPFLYVLVALCVVFTVLTIASIAIAVG